MMTDEKIALMFELAKEQQNTVQKLITDAKEIQRQMEYQGLNVAKIAVQAVKEEAKTEVTDRFKQYETNLKNLLSKADQANQALESATKKFSYKLISGFAIFAFACTISLFGLQTPSKNKDKPLPD